MERTRREMVKGERRVGSDIVGGGGGGGIRGGGSERGWRRNWRELWWNRGWGMGGEEITAVVQLNGLQ